MVDFGSHYDRLEPLYSELGEIDNLYCAGNHDFTGWYNNRAGRARMWALGREYGGIKQNLDRVLYASNTYASVDWFMSAFTTYEWDESTDPPSRIWHGDTPTPDYGNIEAYAPFADIDLADDVKHRRPDGEIPRQEIESALSMYINAFAELAGGREHVFALDSVGGAYVLIAPTATRPIAELLDQEGRKLLFEDMVDKLNEWLADVDESVLSKHPDLEGVFSADTLNNKNRLYKAPLSVHGSLHGVVTPVETKNPSYEFAPVSSVSDGLIQDAIDWAKRYTAAHTDAVGQIVATLWPDHHADSDGWQDTVRTVVDELEEQRQEHRETDGTAVEASEVPDDIDATDDIEVINAKIEAIDVRDVARRLADDYDTDNRGGNQPTRFDPAYRQSESGTSCFVDRDKFVDLEEGNNGGGALFLVARTDRDIDVNHCNQSLEGEDYWKAVAKLRGMGYDIPRFKGKDGSHPDYFGLYDDVDSDEEKRKQVAKALNL